MTQFINTPGFPGNGQALFQTPLVDPTTGLINRQWYQFFLDSQRAAAISSVPVFDITTFGARTDGGGDVSTAVMNAYAAAVAAGGGIVYVPPALNYYSVVNPIKIGGSTEPVTILGVGRSSLFKRRGMMPEGIGMFDILDNTSNLSFDSIMTDAEVTQSVGVTYASLSGDPLEDQLSRNTSFWIHNGSSFINFTNVVITHTGGYAVLADARTADITDLYFDRLYLENNRPILFGFTLGTALYGSWCGGVLFEGNGLTSNAMIRRAKFVNCSAKRVCGNAFWQHLKGFSSLHEDITFSDMTGLDLGRDFMQFGGISGGSITGGNGRRIGYITTDDTSPSIPRWLVNQWAVGVDHSGLAINTTTTGLNLISVNGGAFDCDGMAGSSITGCVCRTPRPDDPEYEEDRIADPGFNLPACYGIQVGNSNYDVRGGKENLVAVNHLTNFPAGAVRYYAARKGSIIGNEIWHPDDAGLEPIIIGNSGPAESQQSYGVTVVANPIRWNPPVPRFAVKEDPSLAPFNPGTKNIVLGNPISCDNGNVSEFGKDAGTNSVGSFTGPIPAADDLVVVQGYIVGHS